MRDNSDEAKLKYKAMLKKRIIKDDTNISMNEYGNIIMDDTLSTANDLEKQDEFIAPLKSLPFRIFSFSVSVFMGGLFLALGLVIPLRLVLKYP